MDLDGSSNEEYGPMKLYELIQKEFFDSSIQLSKWRWWWSWFMNMKQKMDREVEDILNFKGTNKGRRVLNQDMVSGAWLLFSDKGRFIT